MSSSRSREDDCAAAQSVDVYPHKLNGRDSFWAPRSFKTLPLAWRGCSAPKIECLLLKGQLARWLLNEGIAAIDVCSDFRILETVHLVLVLAVAFGGGGFVVAH
jgi:hypothetical protein